MTTLISQFNMIASDSIPIQNNSLSSTSTRFSLSLPIDTTNTKSNRYILKSTSLISALISPHHHHLNRHTNHESNQSNQLLNKSDQTLSSSSTSSINHHQNRLPRPRALSSSHLPPPFPSPSGTFLPPPSTHYLPLKLPTQSERKSRSNQFKSNCNLINQEHQEFQNDLKLIGHKRYSSLQNINTLNRSEINQSIRKRSLSSTMIDSTIINLHSNSNLIKKQSQYHHPILIRDFGFPLTDDRHYKTIETDNLKPNQTDHSRTSVSVNSLEESFQSRLCLPSDDDDEEEEEEEEKELRHGSNKPNLWTTIMRTERNETDNNEVEEEEEDGLREEIERRRESLDKSLQSIGRPSIGSNLDSSGTSSSEEEEDEGLWVALYDFVAEGEGEMGIYEGEILRVIKVVCDGWVIAKKVPGELDEDGKFIERVLSFNNNHNNHDQNEDLIEDELNDLMGLCPQNYLARI